MPENKKIQNLADTLKMATEMLFCYHSQHLMPMYARFTELSENNSLYPYPFSTHISAQVLQDPDSF